jgi:predicted molibdopterin-dependent oxidoreductase YjgC
MTDSMVKASAKKVTLRIDQRTLQAETGAYVLEVAKKAGIEIPTLCHHPDLESIGACRLCLVEVTHPQWRGWSGLMTACLYPVAEGLEIFTRSPRVLEARRGILRLLAARCPQSKIIGDLAGEYGITRGRLLVEHGADECILCGLCTRVCETYATYAIATCSRGSAKRIGSLGNTPPQDCVGCGACAAVCPTGNIAARFNSSGYHIWQRTFETPICTIRRERCLGCGRCEERCPFAVARVVLKVNGEKVATIDAEHCRGCGACIGACPSGAIIQPRASWIELLQRGVGLSIHQGGTL